MSSTRQRIRYALVLPNYDFMDWFKAARAYTEHFQDVVIIRSPAGNNLNRYHTVSAVNAPRVWFNDDPLFHIRRAYPVVVTVDVIDAQTPAALKQALDARRAANKHFGEGDTLHTRFTLDWMTDDYTLNIGRVFDEVRGGGKPHEGVDLNTEPGTVVRAAAAGTVFNVVTNTANSLGYGQYVQINAAAQDGTRYTITYANLEDIAVSEGQSVAVGDKLAASAGTTIKVVVQQDGVDTGSRYALPNVIDPLALLYVEGLTLYTTVTGGLNVRRGQNIAYAKVGVLDADEAAYTLEPHGITIRKTATIAADNKWVNLDTASGVTGYAAAWYLQARSSHSAVPVRDFNGVNLDILNALGKPDPARLGEITYVRLPYNVSMGRGSQDLNAAYNLYAPYVDALLNAGKQIIMVYTHQTYGEGAGYVWPQMTTDRWRELAGRFSDFVQQIARRYRGKIAAHQIWNEQDAHAGATASVSMSPGDYALILSGAIQAIRSEDSRTPIITGGHTAGPWNGSNYARSTLEALPSGVRPDGIAAHPYGRGTNPDSKYAIFGHIDDTITQYSQVLPGRRIWLTEWGVLNAPGEPAADISAYAVDFLTHLQRHHADKVAAAVWYAWADGMHNGYGLVGNNNQPKQPLYSNYLRIR